MVLWWPLDDGGLCISWFSADFGGRMQLAAGVLRAGDKVVWIGESFDIILFYVS